MENIITRENSAGGLSKRGGLQPARRANRKTKISVRKKQRISAGVRPNTNLAEG
jgi:hypothetical protein